MLEHFLPRWEGGVFFSQAPCCSHISQQRQLTLRAWQLAHFFSFPSRNLRVSCFLTHSPAGIVPPDKQSDWKRLQTAPHHLRLIFAHTDPMPKVAVRLPCPCHPSPSKETTACHCNVLLWAFLYQQPQVLHQNDKSQLGHQARTL